MDGSDRFAMITNIGSYDGENFHLKLESALADGVDESCDEETCAISVNSHGVVNFAIQRNSTHPIRFTFIDASTNDQIMRLPLISLSVFDIGAKGRDGVCT